MTLKFLVEINDPKAAEAGLCADIVQYGLAQSLAIAQRNINVTPVAHATLTALKRTADDPDDPEPVPLAA